MPNSGLPASLIYMLVAFIGAAGIALLAFHALLSGIFATTEPLFRRIFSPAGFEPLHAAAPPKRFAILVVAFAGVIDPSAAPNEVDGSRSAKSPPESGARGPGRSVLDGCLLGDPNMTEHWAAQSPRNLHCYMQSSVSSQDHVRRGAGPDETPSVQSDTGRSNGTAVNLGNGWRPSGVPGRGIATWRPGS
jgi:hypothetical protein